MKPSRGITVFTHITTMGVRGERAACALPSAFHTMEVETPSTGGGAPPQAAQFAATLPAAARSTFSARAAEGSTPSLATLRTARALLASRLGRHRALRALVTRRSGPHCPPGLGSQSGSLRFCPAGTAGRAPAAMVAVLMLAWCHHHRQCAWQVRRGNRICVKVSLLAPVNNKTSTEQRQLSTSFLGPYLLLCAYAHLTSRQVAFRLNPSACNCPRLKGMIMVLMNNMGRAW